MKTAFVVLGMHRSGTSSVAGVLSLLGATPPRTLMGPKPDNPTGFWESEVLMAFNDEILAMAGSSWDDVAPLDGAVFEGESGAALKDRAARELAGEFGEAETIVLKDPRICRFYPFWRDALTAAGYRPLVVMPIRDPAEVAASLGARNGLTVEHGLALWRRHVEDAERDSRGQPRHVMAWEDFLRDWRGQAEAMTRAFGAPAAPSSEVAARVDAFLDQSLSAHSARALPAPDAETARVHDALLALAENEKPDGADDPQATAEDIRHVYRLFLRREPEDETVILNNQGRDLLGYARLVLDSDEFRQAAIVPLEQGRLPVSCRDALSPATLDWALRRLPLGPAARRALKTSATVLQAYHAILPDLGLADLGPGGAQRLAALATAARFQAALDAPRGRTLTGWARSLDRPDVPLRLEIWAGHRFLGVAVTGHPRHDTAGLPGAAGHEGFAIDLPDTVAGPTRVVIREVAARLVLIDHEFDVPPPVAPQALDDLRQELDRMTAAIEALKHRLPERLVGGGHGLERYGAHYDRWLRNAVLSPGPHEDAPALVILDAVQVPHPALEDAIWSLLAQNHGNFALVVGVLRQDLAFLHDLMARARWRRDLRIDYLIADADPCWRDQVEIGPEVALVQAMRADGVLHPDALRVMADRFADRPERAAVYGDEDEFMAGDLADWSRREHAAPRLKPAFDYDLLLQTPYVGGFVAFSRAAWLESRAGTGAPVDAAASRLEAPRRLLALSLAEAEIAHVPAVLFTRSGPAEPARAGAWAAIVAGHLAGRASVEAHADILGAVVEGAARVRWPCPAGATAAIVIPTRDRADLLKPCVDSVLASLPANATRTRLRLVDHQTVEPEAAAYLSALADREDVKVTPFSGAFNWALMNNLAAHALDDDVLIFLNNDTLVITPDWIDELTALAMRDDVGVVGCRLLYADGALQHAGFLALDSRERFLAHDGLGDPGASAGYLGRNALTHRTVAVTGACMAVRREVFRRLGGFDAARFPVEANDVDLCFKASEAGLKVLYSPFATLYHLESRTRTHGTDADIRMSADARDQVWARWGGKVLPDPWYNPHFDRAARHFSWLAVGR